MEPSIQTQLNSKQPTLGFTPEDTADKGAANGYAGLDISAKVSVSQIPIGIPATNIADVLKRDFEFISMRMRDFLEKNNRMD